MANLKKLANYFKLHKPWRSSFNFLAADIKPSVMIVEEAAVILEGQLVAVIPPSVQHLIMIGDHKQLKPMVHFHRLRKHHHLDLSMFERLVNCKLPYKQLEFQCRMKEEIVDLLRELKIYSKLQTNVEVHVMSWYYCYSVKLKPKQLQLPITANANNTTNQWKVEANTRNQSQARENVCNQFVIVFLWYLIGSVSGASFLFLFFLFLQPTIS